MTGDIIQMAEEKDICKVWNERFKECREKAGYKSQKSFAKAFKAEYGITNQADISRWERIGETIERNKIVRTDQGEQKIRDKVKIGFPSYENMKRVAEFLGVTVGYLTGETEFSSFDMEKACGYLGVSEAAGKTIREITKPQHIYSFDFLFRKEHGSAFEYMLTAKSFKRFLENLCVVATTIRRQTSISCVDELKRELDPELINLALRYMGVIQSDEPWDIPDTPEFYNVLEKVEEADALETSQRIELDRELKAEKYALYEIFIKLVDEIVSPPHLETMTKRYMHAFSTVEEMRRYAEEDAAESLS